VGLSPVEYLPVRQAGSCYITPQGESTNYSDKGLKRVKIKASDNKRIGDQIKIENL
jgi:hypothetical protein